MKRLGFVVPVLGLAACIDFGFDVPAVVVPDAAPVPDGAASGADAGGCVEGVVPPSSSGPQVAIITLNVSPRVLDIQMGDTVTWTNTDTDPHTVTAGAPGAELPVAQGGFDSGSLSPGARFAFRFCTMRTAIYFCKTHPQQMNGFRVVVH